MSLNDKIEQEAAQRGERKALADLEKRLPVGVQLKGGEGYITIETDKADPPDAEGWNWFLDKHPGTSSKTHEIDLFGTVETGFWQQNSAEHGTVDLFRYKAKVRLKRPGERLAQAKIDELSRLVRRRKAVDPPISTAAMPLWYVLCLADLQLGKASQGGYGTPETVERVRNSIASAAAAVKAGDYTGVLICELGDITEGCQGHYDNQAYTIDLNLTDQVDLSTEILLLAVDTFAKLVPRVLVGVVPSNHGEIRSGGSGGSIATDRARDNLDLVIANSLTRILAANPDRYAHCEVWVPPLEYADPYILTLDLDGVMVGLTHGHQVRMQGVGRMAKAEKWWTDYQWSDRKRPRGEVLPSIADADILMIAHGHTFLLSENTGKLLIQSPSSETQSEWWTTARGNRSSPGVLAFEVSERWPMLANHFSII